MIIAQIVEVLVAEEDYKYDLSDWDTFRSEVLEEIFKDARGHEESFVWIERWLIPTDGDNFQTMDWDIHSLLNRSVKVIHK